MKRAQRILDVLTAGGASDAFYVGGCVRDRLMGIDSKDIDIEVYGLSYDDIVRLLRPHFHVDLVGKSFGIVKVGHTVDVGIPRRESKTGSGHKGFDVLPDPAMSPLEAMGRRDFTINAIGMRPDGTLIDPFDGQSDLRQGILRATTRAFAEDPLRVLRGMQFAARFGFAMDEATIELSRSLRPEFETLAPERVWIEWEKWATKGQQPSLGLLLLEHTGWIDCFPELAALRGTPQNPRFHPEGDVLTHTCLTVDAAVQVADTMRLTEEERKLLLFAALCHDFGKPYTTIRREDGTWTSPNHAAIGVSFAESFLRRMRAPGWLLESIRSLVAEHMAHMALPPDEEPSERSVRRLAVRLAPVSIRLWAALCRSDAKGCQASFDRHRTDFWEEVAERLAVNLEKPKPIIQGRHLLELGYLPGPDMGRLLHAAYEAQLDGLFHTITEGIDHIRSIDESGASTSF